MSRLRATARLLVPALLVATCISEDRNWEEANQLLVKAADAETFRQEQPKFHLTVKLLLQHTNKGKVTGTFERDFVGPERWADWLEAGDFRQERVRIDKQVWRKKNQEFVPMQVDLIYQALFTTTFQMAQSDVVNRIHNRNFEGTDVRCIEFQNVLGRNTTGGEMCVDRATGTLVYWRYGSREIRYSNYVPFAGKVRPSHFSVTEAGTSVVEGDVSYRVASEIECGVDCPAQRRGRGACLLCNARAHREADSRAVLSPHGVSRTISRNSRDSRRSGRDGTGAEGNGR